MQSGGNAGNESALRAEISRLQQQAQAPLLTDAPFKGLQQEVLSIKDQLTELKDGDMQDNLGDIQAKL